jgi:tRNA threonylcarbamoyladenosine biosynthesis protein TsaB
LKILAIETSTEACSVALVHGEEILARSELAPRRHGELVLPMADSLLAEAGMSRQALEGIAVGRGPGAFTGVRLAISLAQGMAMALDLPVVTVSSLQALAMEEDAGLDDILAVIDARMGEVYAAAYRRGADGQLESLSDEWVGPPASLTVPPGGPWSVVGTGWATYAAQVRERIGSVAAHDGACYPQARNVALLALPAFRAGKGVSAEHALPVYLRDKVALTLAEQGKH